MSLLVLDFTRAMGESQAGKFESKPVMTSRSCRLRGVGEHIDISVRGARERVLRKVHRVAELWALGLPFAVCGEDTPVDGR
jgi:hypothetical protein